MKKLLKLFLILFLLWQFIGIITAYYTTRGNSLEITHLLKESNLPFQELILKTENSSTLNIAASYLPAQKDTAVIILAGIRGNRVAGLPHANYYHKKGYGVLLIDLRATGESEGHFLSFGYHEKAELLAGVEFLNQQNISHIGAHGMSLGAATIIYSFAEKTDYAFVVLESPYDNIRQAFYNRMPILPLDNFIFKPLVFWTKVMAKVEMKDLAPEDYIHLYKGKMLLIAGDREEKVRPIETQQLFDKMTTSDKYLEWIEGARHVHFFNQYPDRMKVILDEFYDVESWSDY